MKRKFKVLYTHQKTKKKKTWQDGLLTLAVDEKIGFLTDEDKTSLSTVYIRNKKVENGLELDCGKYLIQVDEEVSGNSPQQSQPAKQTTEKIIPAKPLINLSNSQSVVSKKRGFTVPRKVPVLKQPVVENCLDNPAPIQHDAMPIISSEKSIWNEVVPINKGNNEKSPKPSKHNIRDTEDVLKMLGCTDSKFKMDQGSMKAEFQDSVDSSEDSIITMDFLDDIPTFSNLRPASDLELPSKCPKLQLRNDSDGGDCDGKVVEKDENDLNNEISLVLGRKSDQPIYKGNKKQVMNKPLKVEQQLENEKLEIYDKPEICTENILGINGSPGIGQLSKVMKCFEEKTPAILNENMITDPNCNDTDKTSTDISGQEFDVAYKDLETLKRNKIDTRSFGYKETSPGRNGHQNLVISNFDFFNNKSPENVAESKNLKTEVDSSVIACIKDLLDQVQKLSEVKLVIQSSNNKVTKTKSHSEINLAKQPIDNKGENSKSHFVVNTASQSSNNKGTNPNFNSKVNTATQPSDNKEANLKLHSEVNAAIQTCHNKEENSKSHLFQSKDVFENKKLSKIDQRLFGDEDQLGTMDNQIKHNQLNISSNSLLESKLKSGNLNFQNSNRNDTNIELVAESINDNSDSQDSVVLCLNFDLGFSQSSNLGMSQKVHDLNSPSRYSTESSIEPSKQEKPSIEPSKQEKPSIEPSKQEKPSIEPSKQENPSIEPSKQEKPTIEPSKQKKTGVEENKEKPSAEASKQENQVVPSLFETYSQEEDFNFFNDLPDIDEKSLDNLLDFSTLLKLEGISKNSHITNSYPGTEYETIDSGKPYQNTSVNDTKKCAHNLKLNNETTELLKENRPVEQCLESLHQTPKTGIKQFEGCQKYKPLETTELEEPIPKCLAQDISDSKNLTQKQINSYNKRGKDCPEYEQVSEEINTICPCKWQSESMHLPNIEKGFTPNLSPKFKDKLEEGTFPNNPLSNPLKHSVLTPSDLTNEYMYDSWSSSISKYTSRPSSPNCISKSPDFTYPQKLVKGSNFSSPSESIFEYISTPEILIHTGYPSKLNTLSHFSHISKSSPNCYFNTPQDIANKEISTVNLPTISSPIFPSQLIQPKSDVKETEALVAIRGVVSSVASVCSKLVPDNKSYVGPGYPNCTDAIAGTIASKRRKLACQPPYLTKGLEHHNCSSNSSNEFFDASCLPGIETCSQNKPIFPRQDALIFPTKRSNIHDSYLKSDTKSNLRLNGFSATDDVSKSCGSVGSLASPVLKQQNIISQFDPTKPNYVNLNSAENIFGNAASLTPVVTNQQNRFSQKSAAEHVNNKFENFKSVSEDGMHQTNMCHQTVVSKVNNRYPASIDFKHHTFLTGNRHSISSKDAQRVPSLDFPVHDFSGITLGSLENQTPDKHNTYMSTSEDFESIFDTSSNFLDNENDQDQASSKWNKYMHEDPYTPQMYKSHDQWVEMIVSTEKAIATHKSNVPQHHTNKTFH